MLFTDADLCADPPEGIREGSTGQFHQTQGRLDHDSQLLPDVLPPNPGEYTTSGPRVLVWEGRASKERLLAVAVQVSMLLESPLLSPGGAICPCHTCHCQS